MCEILFQFSQIGDQDFSLILRRGFNKVRVEGNHIVWSPPNLALVLNTCILWKIESQLWHLTSLSRRFSDKNNACQTHNGRSLQFHLMKFGVSLYFCVGSGKKSLYETVLIGTPYSPITWGGGGRGLLEWDTWLHIGEQLRPATAPLVSFWSWFFKLNYAKHQLTQLTTVHTNSKLNKK